MSEPAETTTSWVGRVVSDRYEILRPIARGSMGAVYLARHTALDREVALKCLDVNKSRHVQDKAADAKERKRFLREASMLAKLTHPNTVRVFDFGIEGDTPFIVMEYVKGQTLHELLRGTQRLEPTRAFTIARQVCASLGEAHDLGLVHRDLKPANILVTKDFDGSDMVKVVDFGLVKEVRDAVQMTGDGVMVGTPMYMSPEQIRGKELDQRCDIYALGVVLFKMLLGRPPFVESQTAALLVAHIADPVPAFSEIDPELRLPVSVEFTVRKCLEKHPEQRFATSRDLLRALKVCEAAILDDGMASSAQFDLMEGRRELPPELSSNTSDVVDHRMIEQARRNRRNRRIKVFVGSVFAMLFAVSFGYVGVRGAIALSGALTADATEPVAPMPAEPTPPPAPAPKPEPEPEPDDEGTEPEAEPPPEPTRPAPAAKPAAPKPAAPKPAAPRPAAAKPAAPKPATAPVEPAPQPKPEAPKSKPTNDLGGSDLEDPWSTNGDAK